MTTLERRLGFSPPTPSVRVSAMADFEQHLGKAHAAKVCASCGTPEALKAVAGQLVPVSYLICEACS